MAISSNIHSIDNVLIEFQNSYNQRDAKRFLSLFDGNNPHTMLWGTGSDEVRFGLRDIALQLKRDWEQSDSAELTHFSILANDIQGDFAIVAADWSMIAVIHRERYNYPLLRSTFVFRLISSRWLIQHMHWSLPADQDVGSSFPET